MNAVMPIYYQIKQAIKSWIVNKECLPGEKIPSENELANKFNASRLTIRQAISQLIHEGFLISKRGEGTFVTNDENLINSFSFEFSGFMDDVLYQIPKVIAKSVTIDKIEATRLIKEKLALDENAKEVVQIKRVRYVRERLFTYTINYLPMEVGTKIVEKDLYQKKLLEILEKDLGIRFTQAVQTIEATFADQEVAEKLAIASGSPVLFVERTMYVERHKPIEVYQSFYRGDLYKFIIRFQNIKRKGGSKWIHQFDVPISQKEERR